MKVLMKRLVILYSAVLPTALAQRAAVTGVTGATFHVNDLAKARRFYADVFSLEEIGGAGEGNAAFQINAAQLLIFSTTGTRGQEAPLDAIGFGTGSKTGAALQDPDGRRLEFHQVPEEGVFRVGEKSLSNHLLHVGMGVADMNRAIEFYSQFGFKEIFRRPDFKVLIMRAPPGPREDWIEFIQRGEQGSDHICLAVSDIQRAFQALQERGAAIRGKPRIASNGYWVINMVDSNGIRVELMEPKPAAR
jgi:catechol 2,3-dioxygenase-like lactoylglutathione lyase family enzyme